MCVCVCVCVLERERERTTKRFDLIHLRELKDREAWHAAVHGVAKSWT